MVSLPRRSRFFQRGRLALEPLEDRTLLNGDTLATAEVFPFLPKSIGATNRTMTSPNEVDLFALDLQAQLPVAISVTDGNTRLRIFDAAGVELAAIGSQNGPTT